MKVIIFGTGSTAEKILNEISSSVEVIGFSDNDKRKWGTLWNNMEIFSPFDLKNLEYDFIIIGSMYTKEICYSLIERGINREKIVSYFDNFYTYNDQKREMEIRDEIIQPTRSRSIALLTRRNSGCNCRALYKNIPNTLKKQFEISLIELEEYKRQFEQFEVAFTTNLEGRNYKSKINIEMWHGFPLKTLGYLEKNCTDNFDNTNRGIDYIISYSNFYSYIMSSVFKIDITKFISTGMPRNDFLINVDAEQKLTKLIDKPIGNKKVIFYVPTFRKRRDKINREGMDVFSCDDEFNIIDKYLQKNNIYFFVKKHPVEGDSTNKNQYSNIFFIDDSDLKNMNIDFYEVLGRSDILITDYSSVYFDYLLLNKPIIFWTKDEQEYIDKRGFLFDNHENLMPGPKIKSVDDLLVCISKFNENKYWYDNERKNIKKLVHRYDDFNSSERVWDIFLNKYF